jgi:hypothetical protein
MGNTTALITMVDSALRTDPEAGPVAIAAARLLEEEATGTSEPATATWWGTDDPLRGKRVHVRIVDEKQYVEDDYAIAELETDAKYLMIRLWGDLLELRLKGLAHPVFMEAFRRVVRTEPAEQARG